MRRRQKNPFESSRNEPRAKTKRECKMAAGNGEKTCWESLSALSLQSNFLFLMNMKRDWNESEPQGCTQMQETPRPLRFIVLDSCSLHHAPVYTTNTHSIYTHSWADAAIHTLRIPACIKNSFWKVLIIIVASCCVQSADINLVVLVKCKHTFMYTETKPSAEICFIYNFIKITFTVYL